MARAIFLVTVLVALCCTSQAFPSKSEDWDNVMKELLEKFGKNNLEKAAVEPFILKNTLWGVKKIVDDALNDVKDILGIVVGLDNNKKGTDKVQVAGMKDLTGKLKDKLEKLENKMNEIGDTIETGINEGRQKLEDWAENKQKELEDLAEDVKNKYEELKKKYERWC